MTPHASCPGWPFPSDVALTKVFIDKDTGAKQKPEFAAAFFQRVETVGHLPGNTASMSSSTIAESSANKAKGVNYVYSQELRMGSRSS